MNFQISALLAANSNPMVAGFGKASIAAQGLQRVVGSFTGIFSRAKDVLVTTAKAAIGFGISVGTALAGSTVAAMRFEEQMRNVNSISKLNEGQFRSASQAVVEMSTRGRQSAVDLAKGLYDIASSGFQGAEGLMVLQSAQIAASAGMSTTATSAYALTAVLNAYGMEARSAKDVSDILFQTVNLGVVSFEELAAGVGDWVGMAAAAGVKVEEAAAAIATMTTVGVGANEAATSLARLMEKLIDPSEALKAVMQDLGYESGVTMIQTLGLRGTMDALRVATGGSVEAMIALFPEVRAARGALALMSNEGQTYARIAPQIEDRTNRMGAAMDAYEEQSKSAAFQMDQFKNTVGAAAISVGQTFLPVLGRLLERGSELVNFFNSLPAPIKTTLSALAAISSIMVTLGGIFLLNRLRATLFSRALEMIGVSGGKLGVVTRSMHTLEAAQTRLTGVAQRASAAQAASAASSGLMARGVTAVGVAAGRAAAGIGFFTTAVTFAQRAIPIVGQALLLATLAYAMFGGKTDDTKQKVEELADAFQDLTASIDDAVEATSKKSLQDKDQLDDLQRLGIGLARYNEMLTDSRSGLEDFVAAAMRAGEIDINMAGVERGFIDTDASIEEVVDALLKYEHSTSVVLSGNDELISNFMRLQANLQNAAKDTLILWEADGLITQRTLDNALATGNYYRELERIRPTIDAVAAAEGEHAAGLEIAQAASEAAQKEMEEYRSTIDGLASTLRAYVDPASTFNQLIEDHKTQAREMAEATAEGTKSAKDSWEDYYEFVDVTLQELIDTLNLKFLAQAEFQKNLLTIAQAGYGDVALEFQEQGVDTPGLAELAQEIVVNINTEQGVEALEVLRRATESQTIAAADAERQALEMAAAFGGENAEVYDHFGQLLYLVALNADELQVGLRGTSEGAEQNRDMMQEAADKAIALTGAIYEQTGSARTAAEAYGRMYEGLLTTAMQTGLTRDQAIAYLETLGLTPENVTTEIGLEGDQESSQLISGIQGQMDFLDKTVSVPKVSVEYSELAAGVDRVKEILGSLPNVSVPVGGFAFTARAMVGAHGMTVEDHSPQIAPGRWPYRIWAEPQTGGEAYIPRLGDPARASSILETAAGWYGMTLLPKNKVPDGFRMAQRFATGGMTTYDAGPVVVDLDQHYVPLIGDWEQYWKEAEKIINSVPAGAQGVNPALVQAYNLWNASLGNMYHIVSGLRSTALQAQMYADFIAGRGNYTLVAAPGTSNHERGLALDISPWTSAYTRARGYEFGLHWPVPNEPWHTEKIGLPRGYTPYAGPQTLARGGVINLDSFDGPNVLYPGWNVVRNDLGHREIVQPVIGRGGGRVASISVHATIEGVVNPSEMKKHMQPVLDEWGEEIGQALEVMG